MTAMEPALLILDLDETLVWATEEKPSKRFDFPKPGN